MKTNNELKAEHKKEKTAIAKADLSYYTLTAKEHAYAWAKESYENAIVIIQEIQLSLITLLSYHMKQIILSLRPYSLINLIQPGLNFNQTFITQKQKYLVAHY